MAGRPSKKDTIDYKQLEFLCKKGFTDVELATFFGVTEKTINNWKKDKIFLQSLKDWKVEADEVVEKSLYQRAIGYDAPETKVFNNNGKLLTIDLIKHYPPDPTSMIFWLKNRQPDKWREKPEGESDLTNDEIQALKQFAQSQMSANI